MKLTKKQKEIISLMREGWELGFRRGMVRPSYPSRRYWIQQGGIGSGGKSIRLKEKTVDAIAQKGLIKITTENYGSIKYGLTELSKTCQLT